MKNLLKFILIICFTIYLSADKSYSFSFVNRVSDGDINYKKQILTSAGNDSYKLENMDSIMGPDEITRFIKKHRADQYIYYPLDEKFSANFHIHSTASDGSMTPEEILDKAVDLASRKNKTIYIATTDHNTVNGAKAVLDLIQKNPDKYKNIKVILGMEIFSYFEREGITNRRLDIHLLAWGINPYDEELNKVFYKADLNDKWNYSTRTFESAIEMMSKKGLIGIAHPARYVDGSIEVPAQEYYRSLLKAYKYFNTSGIYFAEGFYQSYSLDSEFKLLDTINMTLKESKIIKTGSTDAHGKTILRN